MRARACLLCACVCGEGPRQQKSSVTSDSDFSAKQPLPSKRRRKGDSPTRASRVVAPGLRESPRLHGQVDTGAAVGMDGGAGVGLHHGNRIRPFVSRK